MILLALLFICSPSHAFRASMGFWRPQTVVLEPYTWVGKGANANWSTTANWSGGVVPGSGQTAVFDSNAATGCNTNCSPVLTANLSLAGIKMKSGYNGTINQGSYTIQIGASGWLQYAGTFNGGSGTINVTGNFEVAGGNFISTSNVLSFPGSTNSTVTLGNPSSFTHNSGTVSFGKNLYGDGAVSITASNIEFYNLTIAKYSYYRTVALSGTYNVRGTLTFNGGGAASGTGIINAYGNIAITSNGTGSTTTVNVLGSANQTFSGGGLAAPMSSAFNINKTGGTLTFTGTHAFTNAFTYTSGTVSVGMSTVYFGSGDGSDQPISVNSGSIHFYHVNLLPYYNRTLTITGTVYIDGDVDLNGSGTGGIFSGGTLEVAGNVLFSKDSSFQSTQLAFVGSAVQTVTVASGARPTGGNWTISKTGGSVTLASDLYLTSTGQSLSITSGTLDQNGKLLSIKSTLSLNGNTLTKNLGTLIVNGVTAGTGSLYGGTVNP